jgi:crossover junction endodeoxyribonuclease RusA
VITLPWPPKELNPNARIHWSKLAKYKKLYRTECWVAAQQAGIVPNPDGKIHLKIVFYPPNKQKRDLDNMLASLKAGLDGIADAWRVDDNRFVLTIEVSDNIGGMVKIDVVPTRCGEAESRLAHNQEVAGANPATATNAC